MTLDRLSLRACWSEIGPLVAGRRIEKVRPHGRAALRLELSSRDALFIDVSRFLSGMWLVGRSAALPVDSRTVRGPSRTAALLFKKHLEGTRIIGLLEPHDQFQGLMASRATVLMRTDDGPGASLVMEGAVVAHFGEGCEVGPLPIETGVEKVIDPVAALGLIDETSRATREGRWVILSARDPGLRPLLRRWPVSDPARLGLAEVLSGQSAPTPHLVPILSDDASNAEASPMVVPFEPDAPAQRESSFAAAASRLYVTLRRVDLFRDQARSRLAQARSEAARLSRLKAALERDRGLWPDPSELRLRAEALLAAPPGSVVTNDPDQAGSGREASISLPDPRTGSPIEVGINPRLTLPQNANALYARARNIERQQSAFAERWRRVVLDGENADRLVAEIMSIRMLEDFEPPAGKPGRAEAAVPSPRRYLTSRGLEMLFGRSAAENHDVTFKLAKREDIWFHVLDAPGGHVVLRNREGRATPEDLAEAASLAAFLSERRTEGHVDVQYTERKHLQPAGGSKGRVRVAHAEVIRVAPRDPVGRLRARS